MDRAAKKYRRQVARRLRCGRATKERLLREFDESLCAFLEDEPDADYERIVGAFGAPDAMAATICEGLPEREYRVWQRGRNVRLGVAAILIIALCSLVGCAVIVQFFTAPVEIYETLTIYEGNILSGSSN